MNNANAPGIPLSSPLYKEIKRQMMAALAAGEWKPSAAIPSERRLSERFGSSIGTVRKATDELVDENILIRHQGRGTFVASHTRDRLLYYFFHIVPETGPKAYPEVRLVSFARARADQSAAEKLALDAGDPVYRIRNLLHLNSTPIIVDDIVVSAVRFPALTEARVRDRDSTIYNLYQEAFGVFVVRTRERLRATLAEVDATALLDIERGTPVLQIRRVAYTYNDVPVEYRVSLVNTAHHEYWTEFGRGV